MKVTTEMLTKPCGCRSAGECTHNRFVESDATDLLVDRFATALKARLRRKSAEDKSGWDDPRWPAKDIQSQLSGHVTKAVARDQVGIIQDADVLDIAAFCAFWWNRI